MRSGQEVGGSATVTLVVTQRERFAMTQGSLERLFDSTEEPFELVYVDAGSPAPIRDYLKEQSRRRGFRLIRHEGYLTPNEARNLGFQHVETKYVVFIDNDLLVEPGWLRKLIAAAEETDATIVGPVYLETHGGHTVIHMAGGEMWVTEEDGGRVFHERHRDVHRQAAEVSAGWKREPIDFVEFHCMVVRAGFLRALGGLDEDMRSLHEHIDLCMEAHKGGEVVLLEPAVRVSYVMPDDFDRADRRFWVWRWSENANAASLRRFEKKWDFVDGGSIALEFARGQRLQAYRPTLERITRHMGARIARRADRILERTESAINRRMHTV
jgi:GT2 family glycosyltransferase